LPYSLSEHCISALSHVSPDFPKAKTKCYIQRRAAKRLFTVGCGCRVKPWPRPCCSDSDSLRQRLGGTAAKHSSQPLGSMGHHPHRCGGTGPKGPLHGRPLHRSTRACELLRAPHAGQQPGENSLARLVRSPAPAASLRRELPRGRK